jgi:fibronectin type 3 domain-containing protein
MPSYSKACAILVLILISSALASVCSGQMTGTSQPEIKAENQEQIAGVGVEYENISGHQPSQTPQPSARSVKLSWKASIPASKSPADAVTGYRIYRSTGASVQAIPQNKITCAIVTATSCVDKNVESGATYNYIATGVAGTGRHEKESLASKPATITIP